jgi:hypothetical protein
MTPWTSCGASKFSSTACTTFLDLAASGPTVNESPPASLCVVDDIWFRYVSDMGIAGPDKGQGGSLQPWFDRPGRSTSANPSTPRLTPPA